MELDPFPTALRPDSPAKRPLSNSMSMHAALAAAMFETNESFLTPNSLYVLFPQRLAISPINSCAVPASMSLQTTRAFAGTAFAGTHRRTCWRGRTVIDSNTIGVRMTRSKLRKIRAGAGPDIGLPPGRRMNSSVARDRLAAAGRSAISRLPEPGSSSQEAASGGISRGSRRYRAEAVPRGLQDVPLSITALGTEKLEELHVEQASTTTSVIIWPDACRHQTTNCPGSAKLYMRGVSSGGDGVHSGSPPSVGVYLDEQPVTTIQGMLDLHMYDIARVEALAGPQGTLYGASSEAGTLRIITNKPEFDVLKGAYDVQANDVDHGGVGYSGEGFINVPIGSSAAFRLVGWYEKDAGYIDNVAGSLTYPTSGFTEDNRPAPQNPAPNTRYFGTAKNNYNDVETYGARAAQPGIGGSANKLDPWTPAAPGPGGQRQRHLRDRADQTGFRVPQPLSESGRSAGSAFRSGVFDGLTREPGDADHRGQDQRLRPDSNT